MAPSDARPGIQHTVVFRLRHPLGSPETAAFLSSARSTLSAISGVRDFTVQRQVSRKSRLDWQFSMWFADQDAYDAYDADPAHRAFVADRWSSEVDEFQEFDFVAA